MSPSWSVTLWLLERQQRRLESFMAGPIYVLLNLTPPTQAKKKGFLLRCCPAQSIFSGFFQDLRVSRKILTKDRRIGTAIGRKSGI